MMYCRDCGMNVKVEKKKLKTDYDKQKGYYCSECGVRLMIVYENRRRYS